MTGSKSYMLKIQWIRLIEYPTLLRVTPPREYGKAPRLSLPPPKKENYLDLSQLETILEQFGLTKHFETEEHAGGEVIYRSVGRNIPGVKIDFPWI